VLSGWLIVEMVMLRLVVWPHYLFGTVALVLVVAGIGLVLRNSPRVDSESASLRLRIAKLDSAAKKVRL
jgi:hypothetical protein